MNKTLNEIKNREKTEQVQSEENLNTKYKDLCCRLEETVNKKQQR